MQMPGPAAYVTGLLGKEDRLKERLAQVWNLMPLTEGSMLSGLVTRNKNTVQEGAAALHGLLSLGFALWTGWSTPRLKFMAWPVNVAGEKCPTHAVHGHVSQDLSWWRLRVRRTTTHLSPKPFALLVGMLEKT